MKNRKNRNRPSKRKVILFASVGHALELYDFTMFGVMIPLIAYKFFPSDSALTSMILGYMAFAITFFVAPIGSAFWGWYADKFGRASLLKNSLLLMAFPSVAIALIPTYEYIGIASPILLVIFRIVQGISASGEVIGAKMFAMEHLGQKHYGSASGYISAAGALGVILAMIAAYLSSFDTTDLAWRCSFLIGSFLFIIAALIRKNFIRNLGANKRKATLLKNDSLFKIIVANKHYSALVFLLGAALGIMSYFLHAFINPYLISLGFAKSWAYIFSVCALSSSIIFAVLTGFFIDGGFKLKNITYGALSAYATTSIVLFIAEHNVRMVLAAFIVMGGALGVYATSCGVMMYRSFPEDVKNRGVMFSYGIGVAFFGGATPLILNLVAKFYSQLLPYVVSFVLLSFLMCLRMVIRKLRFKF